MQIHLLQEREELEKKERRHEGLRHIDIGDANEERNMNSTMGKDSSTSLSSSSTKVSKKRRRREKLHKSLENNDTGNGPGEETTHLKVDSEPSVHSDMSLLVFLSRKGHGKSHKAKLPLKRNL